MKKQNLLALFLSCAVSLSAATRAGYTFTDNHKQSFNPPANLKVEQVPCFVVLGFDDNPRAGSATDGGIRFVVDMMRDKVNPTQTTPIAATFDGRDAKVTFYTNPEGLKSWQEDGAPNLIPAYREAFTEGHEMGNHTFDHWRNWQGTAILAASVSDWQKEINDADEWFTKAYLEQSFIDTAADWMINDELGKGLYGAEIPLDSIRGFRAPYLAYNDNTFKVLKEVGIWYDCSIEDGSEIADADGTNLRWPYTLDEGSISASATANTDNGGVGHKDITPTAGLWELPNCPVFIPHDSLASKYDFPTGLRERAGGRESVTGLDYNIFTKKDKGGLGLSAQDFLAILKYTLDQRLKGNRAPFMFGTHSQFYFDAWAGTNSNATGAELRAALEAFVDYALTKDVVRVVRGIDVIEWMRNPVGLNGEVGVTKHSSLSSPKLNVVVSNKVLQISNLSNGTNRVILRNLKGQLLQTTDLSGSQTSVALPDGITPGVYSVQIKGQQSTQVQKIIIQ